jgi:hypothetical protein
MCTLYQQMLALTSPTSGGRSVGIVLSRTQATEFVLFVCILYSLYYITHWKIIYYLSIFQFLLATKHFFLNIMNLSSLAEGLTSTGCGRNNSHIAKNHFGVPKAGSGVWSVPLGRVHNKVFSCCHAVAGWSSRLCSGGVFKKLPPSGHSEQTKFLLLGCWKPSRTPCTTSS